MKTGFIFLFFFPTIIYGQIITTIAGNGSSVFSGENVMSISASTPNPSGGTFDKYGNYFFTDIVNSHRVRCISTNGIIKTVVGNGVAGFSGDGGLATAASLNRPHSIKIDTIGNYYIVDQQNSRIRKIDYSTGMISTIAGNGSFLHGGDGGDATLASFSNPQDIALDKKGNIYIADLGSHRIRKIDVTGTISTFAGLGTLGFSGDGGLATAAELGYPSGIEVDDTGNLYIADASSLVCRVRKIDTFGIITTIAGNGSSSFSSDGLLAVSTPIAPYKVAIYQGDVFVCDQFNNRIYRIEKTTGILYNVAGNGITGDGGDGGLATSASLNKPTGISIDVCGNAYITNSWSSGTPGSGRRIRKVTFNPPTTPTITLSGITTATVGATVTVNATVSGAGSSYTIRWFRNSSLFSTTTTPTTTFVKGIGIDTITARIVPTIVYCYDSTMAAPHRVLEAPVAIGSVPERQQYSVYPNPAQQQLNISSPAAIHTITISSPVGQQWLAYTGSGSTEVQLSVAHLPPGLYIVRVNNGYSTKMIKE